MNLQYIYDDSTSPPAQSEFQYAVGPDTVYVSTDQQTMYADFTITIYNPQSTTIAAQAFQFGFLVGAEYGDLTDSTTGIDSSSDQTAWSISKTASEDPDNPNQYNYTVTPSAAGEQSMLLAANQTLYFHLNGVEINEAEGGEGVVPIFITEITGADANDPQLVQGQLAINKESGNLSVTSFGPTQAGPFDPGSPVTLSWSLMDSDHWQLFEAGTLIYDSETSSPPNADSYTVQPQQNTTYELQAFAGELFVLQVADVMVRAARFVTEPYAEPSEVAYNQTSTLSWQTQYASKLVIAAPGFLTVVLTAPPGQYDLFLQAPDNELAVPPGTYTLTAYGPGNSQDNAQVTILLAIPPPVINTFTATPVVSAPGQGINLAWGTSYGVIAVLSQSVIGNNSPQTPQIVATNSSEYEGSVYPVQPIGISYYTLLLRGQGENQAVSAPLMVIEDAGTYQVEGMPAAMAPVFDGSHIWIADYKGIIHAFNTADGQTTSFDPPENVGGLAFDGSNVWATFSDPDSGSGSVAILELGGGGIQVGEQYPLGLLSTSVVTYDTVNKCLWAAGQNSSNFFYLCKFQISNQQVLGIFPVGNEPSQILFDGAHVWVLNWADGNVTVLNAGDGSMVGNPPYVNNPLTFSSGPTTLAFDGTFVWIGFGDGSVNVLSPADATQVCPPVTFGSDGVTRLAYDGVNVWATQDNGVALLRLVNGAVEVALSLFPVGTQPGYMVFDGTYMWVTDFQQIMLTKL